MRSRKSALTPAAAGIIFILLLAILTGCARKKAETTQAATEPAATASEPAPSPTAAPETQPEPETQPATASASQPQTTAAAQTFPDELSAQEELAIMNEAPKDNVPLVYTSKSGALYYGVRWHEDMYYYGDSATWTKLFSDTTVSLSDELCSASCVCMRSSTPELEDCEYYITFRVMSAQDYEKRSVNTCPEKGIRAYLVSENGWKIEKAVNFIHPEDPKVVGKIQNITGFDTDFTASVLIATRGDQTAVYHEYTAVNVGMADRYMVTFFFVCKTTDYNALYKMTFQPQDKDSLLYAAFFDAEIDYMGIYYPLARYFTTDVMGNGSQLFYEETQK